jgi:hypothetical protein
MFSLGKVIETGFVVGLTHSWRIHVFNPLDDGLSVLVVETHRKTGDGSTVRAFGYHVRASDVLLAAEKTGGQDAGWGNERRVQAFVDAMATMGYRIGVGYSVPLMAPGR